VLGGRAANARLPIYHQTVTALAHLGFKAQVMVAHAEVHQA
jgi:hypothetical protein